MLTFDAEVTLYNKLTKDGTVTWHRTHIPVCSFYGGQAANIAATNFSPRDNYAVRIREVDMPDGYLNPNEYRLGDGSGWTVQQGDVIVRGNVTDTVVRGVTEITNKYWGRCFEVNKVHDNRRIGLKHILIEGS